MYFVLIVKDYSTITQAFAAIPAGGTSDLKHP